MDFDASATKVSVEGGGRCGADLNLAVKTLPGDSMRFPTPSSQAWESDWVVGRGTQSRKPADQSRTKTLDYCNDLVLFSFSYFFLAVTYKREKLN